MSNPFWAAVRRQLDQARTATTAEQVLTIFALENSPYRLADPNWNGMDGGAQGFFAGSGGEDTLDEALDDAGWTWLWSQAPYWWAMTAPDGSVITYCEGDIYRGDKR